MPRQQFKNALAIPLLTPVNERFNSRRSAAGSRTIVTLTGKPPGPHKYQQATVERPDMPNGLDREFDVAGPDEVWCGDITPSFAAQLRR